MALAASACASKSSHSTRTKPLAPEAQDDVALLNACLDVENRTIAVYTAAIPLLKGRDHAAAKRFLEQELSHAALLSSMIRTAGGKPDQPRPSYNFGRPKGRRGLLELFEQLERAQLLSYLDAVARVSRPNARGFIASMLSTDAQHLSVLHLALHEDPFPSAFLSAQS